MIRSEITVEIFCDKDTLFKLLEDRGFKYVAKLQIDDYYYTHVPIGRDIDFRELVTNSFLVRCLKCADFKSKEKSIGYTRLIYKKKEFDQRDKVISEYKISTDVADTRFANEIFQQMGLTQWVSKNANGYGFRRDNQYILVQEVENLGLYIEVEQFDDQSGDKDEILDGLVDFINELEIPCGNDFHENIAYKLFLKKSKHKSFGFNPDVL